MGLDWKFCAELYIDLREPYEFLDTGVQGSNFCWNPKFSRLLFNVKSHSNFIRFWIILLGDIYLIQTSHFNGKKEGICHFFDELKIKIYFFGILQNVDEMSLQFHVMAYMDSPSHPLSICLDSHTIVRKLRLLSFPLALRK